MNSQTAAALATLKDGQGNYLWRSAFLVGQPATLLGFAVEIDENMPGIASGNLPIAFGDFARGYLINDRAGVRILRDPYTNKPFVNFYTTKRVGGGVFDPACHPRAQDGGQLTADLAGVAPDPANDGGTFFPGWFRLEARPPVAELGAVSLNWRI